LATTDIIIDGERKCKQISRAQILFRFRPIPLCTYIYIYRATHTKNRRRRASSLSLSLWAVITYYYYMCIRLFVLFIFFFSKRGERGREHNSRVPGVAVETSAAESFSSPLPAVPVVLNNTLLLMFTYILLYVRGGARVVALLLLSFRFEYIIGKKKESVIKLVAVIASTLISKLDLIARRRTSTPIYRTKSFSAIAVNLSRLGFRGYMSAMSNLKLYACITDI